MTVRYSTNWMGPVSTSWYRDRGLTKRVTKVLEEDSLFSDKKAGEIVEYDEITEQYACGRIDVRGTGLGHYGDEIGLAPMKSEDWHRFGEWLDKLVTDRMWSLKKLLEQYYAEGNPQIEWWEEK